MIFTDQDRAEIRRACAKLDDVFQPAFFDDGDPENGPHLACFPAEVDAVIDICEGIASIGDTQRYREFMDPFLMSRGADALYEEMMRGHAA